LSDSSENVGQTVERRLRALVAIAEALAKGRDAPDVLQSVVDSACDLLDAESARLELLEPYREGSERTRRLAAVSGLARIPAGSVRKADDGTGGYVIATGRPVLVLQLSEGLVEPPEAMRYTSPYLRNESAVLVPLGAQGHVLGTLAVLHSSPFRFDPADVGLMEQFALLATMAVDAGQRLEREESEALRLRALYLATEQVGEGIALVGTDERIRYANPAFGAVHGVLAGDLIGRPVDELMGPGWPWADLAERLMVSGDVRADGWVSHLSGVPVQVEIHARSVADHDGLAPLGTVLVMHEIADRKAAEAKLHRQASSDPLTGLANRRSIIEAVTTALGTARPGRPVALLFVDLDRFKRFNDGLGHRMGDSVLVQVARRFAAALGEGEILGRLGGDEFVVLLETVASPDAALAVAQRLAATLREPIAADGRTLTVSASIGVALAEPGGDVETLLRDADTAMYQAKAAGRDTQSLLDREAAPSFLAELDLEEELRHGVGDGQLLLAFQPVFDLRGGRLEGFEALVRWAHPTRGVLLPAAFLPVAEETDLIRPIGAWVLDRAAEVMTRYLPRLPHLALGVNVSSRQLVGDQLLEQLDDTLGRTGLPPDNLILEITESLAMRPGSERTLHHLRERGVRLAIDDLGTGYSNLSHLKGLPVSIVKVDHSFVAGLGADVRDRAIVATLLGLGSSLGLEVVAEGIETAAQLAVLQELGCPYGQGNLLGPATVPPGLDVLPEVDNSRW
jgi:diguanylate cyclase (GGDEF)-like protein/PAS domain S-box-containing protein